MGGGGKETPRQKMIGMMYLVLTALLAMNVSKDILNAFIAVDDSLVKTNSNFEAKNKGTESEFDLAMLDNKQKTLPFKTAADEISKEANELNKFIKELKAELIADVEKVPKEVADTMKMVRITGKDNYNEPTHLLIGHDEEHADGKAKELKEKIEKFRAFVLNKIKTTAKKPGAAAAFEKSLGLKTDRVYSTFEEKEVSWENNLFYHTPLAADITHLSQIQNSIRNVEGDALELLYNEITAGDFKFDVIEAKVQAASNYVTAGTEYSADLFVAAYSTTKNPQIWLGDVDTTTNAIKGKIDSTSIKVSGGLGKYTIRTSATGLQKYSGIIRMTTPTGEIKPYRFKAEYIVAAPAAAVSPDKMNVFYIGVDNPVSISAAGIAPTDISPSISGCGGSIRSAGKPGQYIVTVTSTGNTVIAVNGKVNGKNTPQGNFTFRVKRVPPPVAFFGSHKGEDKIAKGELGLIAKVAAKMENFDFELTYQVISFNVGMAVGSGYVEEKNTNGPNLTPASVNLLKNAKAGNRVFISEVKVKGPDGMIIPIPGVQLKVN